MSWIEALFLQHADLFLQVAKRRDERADDEVDALDALFSSMGVPRHGWVLDLCCGYGRHALRLATHGYRVTGVDLSPYFIEYGRKLADTMGVPDYVDFHVGDARRILTVLDGQQGTFDAIISMWTSIGYYDVNTDRAILQQLSQLATPRGIVVLEMTNRDWVVKNFQSFGVVNLDGLQVHEHRSLNLEESRMDSTWKVYRKNGESLSHITSIPISHRLYSLHELIALLQTTGWSSIKSFSSLRVDEPVTSNSHKIVMVGRKSPV